MKKEFFKVKNHNWLIFVSLLLIIGIILWFWHEVVLKKCYWTNGKKWTKNPVFSGQYGFSKEKKIFTQVNKMKVNPCLLSLLGVRLGANYSSCYSIWTPKRKLTDKPALLMVTGKWEVGPNDWMQTGSNYSSVCFWLHLTSGMGSFKCFLPFV